MRHITLRRTKETRLASGKTLLDLPDRQDEIRFLSFTDVEREIYDKYFADSARDFNNMMDQKEDGAGGASAGALTAPGIASTSYVNILQKILRLRQICDHRLLMSDSSASAPDEDDSSEPLDYETASAAIATHGLTRKRAASVLAWMKEEAVCDCLECKVPMDDLATSLGGLALAAEEDPSAAAAASASKRKGKAKKPLTGVLTKCQHLFCASLVALGSGRSRTRTDAHVFGPQPLTQASSASRSRSTRGTRRRSMASDGRARSARQASG
jgi:SWI/SNF-related matrix-associated actin-dependent regulator of chromatin subfamily A3